MGDGEATVKTFRMGDYSLPDLQAWEGILEMFILSQPLNQNTRLATLLHNFIQAFHLSLSTERLGCN